MKYEIVFQKAFPPYQPRDKWVVQHRIKQFIMPSWQVDFSSDNKEDCERYIKLLNENKLIRDFKIGTYIRTYSGIIQQVKTYYTEQMRKEKNIRLVGKQDLVNGRFRPIDIKTQDDNVAKLVEVGDYVNGKKVLDIQTMTLKDNICPVTLFITDKTNKHNNIYGDQIEDIVTKEQFNKKKFIVK